MSKVYSLKALRLFFAITLVISMMPVGSAYAADDSSGAQGSGATGGSPALTTDPSNSSGTRGGSTINEADRVYVRTWQELQNAVKNSANKGKVITLENGVDAEGKDRILIKQSLTIDLNGKHVDRERTSNDTDGHVFEIQNSATVTITDSSRGTGAIMGGYATRGGGIHVGKGCTCIVENIMLLKNKAGVDGGAVYVRGKLEMRNCLIKGNNAEDTAGAIYCQDTGSFKLDNVEIYENTAKNDGGAIIAHMKSDSSIKNSKITNNTSKTEDGGAIRMEASEKTLTIENTEISGNTCENDGGAIVIYSGKVKMIGGKISNNKSEDGGAVYNDGGTIDLDGVEISGNETTKKSGGGITNKNNATLKDCTLKDNISKDKGGAIYSNDDITLVGCTLERNSAPNDGGAIYINDAKLNIENCTIRNNTSAKTGGGIRIYDGTTNIKGTTLIEDNTAYEYGGGIYTNNGATLNMEGNVKIHGNSANDGGGGMLVGSSEGNEVTIKGKIYIAGNGGYSTPNVYFRSRNVYIGQAQTTTVVTPLTLKGALEEGSVIGVAIDHEIENMSEVLTSGYKQYHGNTDPATYFSANAGLSVRTNGDGEVVLHTSDWPDLQRLINRAADNNETLTLEKSWTGSVYDLPLTIPEGKTVELNLNGFTINRNLASSGAKENGEVFKLEAGRTLRIADSSAKHKGRIIGGNGKNGGGISVASGASLELAGGTITGNKAENGSGIYNEGTVVVSGSGALSGNTADKGGGVYNKGSLTISTNAINNNDASVGGGIYYAQGATLNVSDAAAVKDNSAASGKNIFMEGNGTLITITSPLTDGAFLDVVAQNSSPKNDRKLTAGWDTNKGSGEFLYNGAAYDPADPNGKLTEKDGELWLKGLNDSSIHWVSTWHELFLALGGDDYDNIALKNDIKAKQSDGDSDYPLMVMPGNTKKLDLCGFKLDADGIYFSNKLVAQWRTATVITVEGGGKLELKDSLGTGMITGGTNGAESQKGGGIRISKNATCEITDCAISGNGLKGDGGGIYNEGTLIMNGGSVFGSKTKKHSGGKGGGIYNNGRMQLTNVTIADNYAEDNGGGIYMDTGSQNSSIKNCRISNNTSGSSYGGGIYINMPKKEISIEDSIIDGNSFVNEDETRPIGATPDGIGYLNYSGGGIYLEKGTLNMAGGAITGNASENGGGIYNADGTIALNGVKIDGNTAAGEVYVSENEESSSGGLGGGIYNKNHMSLTACTISNNKSDESGAGLWTSNEASDTSIVKDCAFESNQAISVGGGIHLAGGKLTLEGSESTGCTFKSNEAYEEASGIQVDGELHVKGKIFMPADSIFLPSGKKIKLDAPLTEGSMIDIALAKTFGVFTDGFKTHHPSDDPVDYFCSDYGYKVLKASDGEAEIKLVFNEGGDFIDVNSQINDVSRLTKGNWMSGISGDRYINEINLPCTHDSAMKGVISHTMSSIGSFLGYQGNAETQVRHIDEQLNDGVRRLDLRLNNRYEKSYALGLWISFKDDGKNLWLCHGKSYIGGTFWATDHDGGKLSLTEVWEWVKDFLQKHPTETIILDLAPEPVNSWGHDTDDDTDTICKRAKKFVVDFSREINPSTGKPYVYWENGVVGKNMTRYPMLKECRGQVIFAGDCNVGGINNFGLGGNVTTREPEGAHGESAADKIRHTYEFYNKNNIDTFRLIPKDVTEHLEGSEPDKGLLYRVSALTAPLGLAEVPLDTPLNAADQIHEALYYASNDETGVFNQRGQYVGWIRQDGVTARTNRVIWMSNFPEDDPATSENEGLNYCTVTAYSNISDEDAQAAGLDPKQVKVQEYKLLKGTEFTIPGNIYGYNKQLKEWDANVPSGSEAAGEASYAPGATYRIMSDVAFTADWGTESHDPGETITKFCATWVDQDNADEIRPTTLTVTYLKNGSAEEQSISLPVGDAWESTVSGLVTKVISVSDGGVRIKPTIEHPRGQDKEGEYSYSVSNNIVTGCMITLYHTPASDPDPEGEEHPVFFGEVSWDDNENEIRDRPETLTLRLMKGGQEVSTIHVDGTGSGWNWSVVLPEGDPTGYSIVQDPIRGYKTEITGNMTDGFVIKNTLAAAGHKHDLNKVETKPATCLEDGNIEYWVCNKEADPCNRYFADAKGAKELDPAKTAEDGGIILPATGHDWGDPEYIWSEDNSTVTARMVCKHDATHVIEEAANTTSEITREPTKTEDGEEVFAGIFKGESIFVDQYKTVNLPATGIKHTITFKLNGGSYNGNADDLVMNAYEGDTIIVPDAPERAGYTFLYWKGSEYYPGEEYTVKEDHTLTAQWEKNEEPAGDGDDPGDSDKGDDKGGSSDDGNKGSSDKGDKKPSTASGAKSSTGPTSASTKTGDASNPYALFTLGLVSLVGITASSLRLRRMRRKNDE